MNRLPPSSQLIRKKSHSKFPAGNSNVHDKVSCKYIREEASEWKTVCSEMERLRKYSKMGDQHYTMFHEPAANSNELCFKFQINREPILQAIQRAALWTNYLFVTWIKVWFLYEDHFERNWVTKSKGKA